MGVRPTTPEDNMPTITQIDRNAIRTINAEALPALEEIAKQFGLTLKQEGGRFDPTAGTFTMKVTFVCQTADGIPADWSRYAPTFGLAVEDFGKTFRDFSGKPFTVCGIKPRSSKYPVLAKNGAGKVYKFPATQVKAMLAMSVKAL
jgi:hypothetical protein